MMIRGAWWLVAVLLGACTSEPVSGPAVAPGPIAAPCDDLTSRAALRNLPDSVKLISSFTGAEKRAAALDDLDRVEAWARTLTDVCARDGYLKWIRRYRAEIRESAGRFEEERQIRQRAAEIPRPPAPR